MLEQPSPKPLRADARRNRDALLVAARAAFSAGELDLRIEEIARRAGVGVGTLYRHFETRDALIKAVYRQEVDAICASASQLLETLPADEALFAFLRGMVAHLAHNLGLAGALVAVMATRSAAFAHGSERLDEAIATLHRAAVATGRIRADIAPQTLLMALCGLSSGHDQPGWEQQANAVVTLLVDGLRFGAANPR